MKFKRPHIIWLILLVYLIFLGFNISHHNLSSDKNYTYWEISLLGQNFCGAPTLRFGMSGVGTTFDPEDKILSGRCGPFRKLIIGEAKYLDSKIAAPIPYYNVYCQGISFERAVCIQ